MKPKTAKITKTIILVLLLSYAAVMTVWANREATRHVCTEIVIDVESTGAMDSVIRRGVREELRAYPQRLVGTPLHELNTAAVEKYLTKKNSFESVNCMISSRGQLIVKVVPLIPVMRVFYGGKSYYINKEGKFIESNAEFFSDVMPVTGNFNKRFAPKDILPLVNFINGDETMSELVTMIMAENKSNLILVPRIRGHVINFGDTTRLKEKKEALTLFYRKVIPYKGWEEYDTISVRFRGQIVATRRDKTRLNHTEQYVEDYDPEEATLPDGGSPDDNGAQPDSTTNNKPNQKAPEGQP